MKGGAFGTLDYHCSSMFSVPNYHCSEKEPLRRFAPLLLCLTVSNDASEPYGNLGHAKHMSDGNS